MLVYRTIGYCSGLQVKNLYRNVCCSLFENCKPKRSSNETRLLTNLREEENVNTTEAEYY